MIVATKFTGMQITEREKEGGNVIKVNYCGNSAKNIFTSIERSLKALKTSYIDLVSFDNFLKPEIMANLQWVVLYPSLGLNDIDSRTDACPQRSSHSTQGPLSRHQRHTSLDRRQSKLLRTPARAATILRLSRTLGRF